LEEAEADSRGERCVRPVGIDEIALVMHDARFTLLERTSKLNGEHLDVVLAQILFPEPKTPIPADADSPSIYVGSRIQYDV